MEDSPERSTTVSSEFQEGPASHEQDRLDEGLATFDGQIKDKTGRGAEIIQESKEDKCCIMEKATH